MWNHSDPPKDGTLFHAVGSIRSMRAAGGFDTFPFDKLIRWKPLDGPSLDYGIWVDQDGGSIEWTTGETAVIRVWRALSPKEVAP